MSSQGELSSQKAVEEIKRQLYDSAEIKKEIAEKLSDEISKAALAVIDCLKRGGKVILLGNGGSTADAQHLAGELVGRFKMERDALPVMSLSANTSILTALANDYGYDTTFARQIEAWVKEGDVVFGISTSGNSTNVLEGIKRAKELGAKTIGLTGGNGGRLSRIVDLALVVPSSDTPRIQEGHITIGHIICHIVEEALFGHNT